MGLTVARCPSCGANLDLKTDKDYFYCPHCGSKVLQQNDRIVIEHVIRTVDEAKVKREEMKQAKVAAKTEEKRIEAERQKAIIPWLIPVIIIYLIILGGVLFSSMSVLRK